MPDESPDIERELQVLEVELKRLEAEYEHVLRGPPASPAVGNAQARRRRWSSGSTGSTSATTATASSSARFRARFTSFVDLWDRGLRAREEGRPGPFAQPRPVEERPKKPAAENRVVHVTTFKDPLKEMDKLHELYDNLAELRRQAGQDAIPFHKFADLIKTQVTQMKEKGSPEVAFRVAMKDGKVAFTARAMKGQTDKDK